MENSMYREEENKLRRHCERFNLPYVSIDRDGFIQGFMSKPVRSKVFPVWESQDSCEPMDLGDILLETIDWRICCFSYEM